MRSNSTRFSSHFKPIILVYRYNRCLSHLTATSGSFAKSSVAPDFRLRMFSYQHPTRLLYGRPTAPCSLSRLKNIGRDFYVNSHITARFVTIVLPMAGRPPRSRQVRFLQASKVALSRSRWWALRKSLYSLGSSIQSKLSKVRMLSSGNRPFD